MTTHGHEYEYEMVLRRALRSGAESIEPRSDGLDKIRTRMRHRPSPLPVAWALAAWMRLAMWVPEGAYTAGRQLAGKLRTVSERFLPEPRGADSRDGQSSWSLLRPLTAFAIAVFVVAVGAYVAIEVPAVVSPTGGRSTQGQSNNGGSPGGGGGLSHGTSSALPSTGSARSAAPSGSASPSSPCLAQLHGPSGGSPSTSPSKSPSPTASPTPSGSGSSSPTGTPSPTPSGTGTSSPTPSASPSAPAGASQPSAGATSAAAGATTDAMILPAAPAVPSVSAGKSPCGGPSPQRTKRITKKRPKHAASPAIAGSVTSVKAARRESSSSA